MILPLNDDGSKLNDQVKAELRASMSALGTSDLAMLEFAGADPNYPLTLTVVGVGLDLGFAVDDLLLTAASTKINGMSVWEESIEGRVVRLKFLDPDWEIQVDDVIYAQQTSSTDTPWLLGGGWTLTNPLVTQPGFTPSTPFAGAYNGQLCLTPSGLVYWLDIQWVGISIAQLTGTLLVEPTVKGGKEYVHPIGVVTTTNTFNLLNGNRQRMRLTAGTTCTNTMPTPEDGAWLTVEVEQAAVTGNGDADFTDVDWGDAGPPASVTAAAGKMDIFTFIANGTKWFGNYKQGFTY